MDTRVINVRKVPSDLARSAKALAAMRGVSLQELVIQLLRDAVQQKQKSNGGKRV